MNGWARENFSYDGYGSMLFLTVVVLVLIVWVVLYAVKKVMYGTFTKVTLIQDRVSLQGNSFQVVANNIPPTVNGNDSTMAFWLKLNDFVISSQHKVMWYRSAATDSLRGCACLLDSKANAMHFLLATNQTPAAVQRKDVLGRAPADIRTTAKMAVASIDYVPMSRWTHIALVIRDRYVVLFVDGEVHRNSAVGSLVGIDGAIVLPPTGMIFIGGEPNINAQVTKMEMSNYAASANDIKDMYEAGPTFTLGTLGGWGIPMYGLTSPIYRVGDY